MKKKFSLFFMVLLAAMLIVAGCGGGTDQPQPADEPEEKQEEKQEEVVEVTRLLMATGGTGGTYYPLGGAIANAWGSHIENLNVTIESTGASVENMRLLGSGETDLAMAMNNAGTAAYLGEGAFEGTPIEGFSALGVIYPEVMQIITPKDSGIKTLADLAGKRVSIGPAGSGTAVAAETILEAFGMNADADFAQKAQDNFADAARKIKDGQLDAAFAVLAVPAANVIDIETSMPVNIVNITGAGLDKLIAADPTFSPYEIPAATYAGLDEPAYTVSNWAVLYVPNDLDEELIYQMTKVMYEKADEIARTHARGDQILIETATLGIAPVPFHPGAARYYKEAGVLK